jgi:hypothetical protein
MVFLNLFSPYYIGPSIVYLLWLTQLPHILQLQQTSAQEKIENSEFWITVGRQNNAETPQMLILT